MNILDLRALREARTYFRDCLEQRTGLRYISENFYIKDRLLAR